LNPLTVTLGVQNVSFVAQAVDWIPETLFQVISAAYRHKGFSFVRILQRCPEFVGDMYEPWVHDPQRTLLLTHEHGLRVSPALAKIYRNTQEHDPSDIHRARVVSSSDDPIPVGILYRNDDLPCYEDVRGAGRLRTVDEIRGTLETEFDKFTVWPQ
jgi:2-oxoglutarate ferredoxin oxidoreductase subunit beta